MSYIDDRYSEGYMYDYENETRCEKCDKEIEFSKNENGKWIPVNPGTETNHFNTCTSLNSDTFDDFKGF